MLPLYTELFQRNLVQTCSQQHSHDMIKHETVGLWVLVYFPHLHTFYRRIDSHNLWHIYRHHGTTINHEPNARYCGDIFAVF